jgi:hypothetical protein
LFQLFLPFYFNISFSPHYSSKYYSSAVAVVVVAAADISSHSVLSIRYSFSLSLAFLFFHK